jgi:Fur family transcriptional regulator, ferric uptake regulator
MFLRRCPEFRSKLSRPKMLQNRIDDQPSISRESMREAEAIFLQHLRRVGLKQTGQRNTILRTFLETREHLSTDELHRLVKKKDAGIGFTTVYRTLKLLAGCGLASEVAFHDGIARYEHQYNRRSHHHMVCTECGASVEFFSPEVGQIEQVVGRNHNYLTTRHTFQIYGICADCRKSESAGERDVEKENSLPPASAREASRKKATANASAGVNGRRIV